MRAHLHVGDGETAATLRLRALAALLLLRARRRHRPRLRAGGGKGGGLSWVKLQRRATGHSCVREAGWGMGAKKAGPNSSSPFAVRTPSEEEPKAAKTHISLRHLRPTSPRDPRLDCHRSHVTPPRTRVDYVWGLFPVRTPSATCNRLASRGDGLCCTLTCGSDAMSPAESAPASCCSTKACATERQGQGPPRSRQVGHTRRHAMRPFGLGNKPNGGHALFPK